MQAMQNQPVDAPGSSPQMLHSLPLPPKQRPEGIQAEIGNSPSRSKAASTSPSKVPQDKANMKELT